MRKKKLRFKDKNLRQLVRTVDKKLARRNFLELLRRAGRTKISSE